MTVKTKSSQRLEISFTVIFLLFLFYAPAFALFYRGGNLGVGVRAMGLSGAFTAIADDPSAGYWNPAGLVQVEQPEIMGMFGSYFNDKDRNLYLAFHYPLENDIHLALSTNNLFYTDIPGGDENQFSGSVAIPVEFVKEKKLLLGVSFTYFLADLGNGNGLAQGRGVDLGLLFRNPFKDDTEIRAGLVLSNISSTARFDNTGVEQNIPPILTAGLAYWLDKYTLVCADAPWTLSDDPILSNENIRVRAGLEHWFFDGRFGLRAGFISFLTLPGDFSIGASYKTTDWSIDYAFMNHSDRLGNSHRLGATYTFNATGRGRPEPKPFMVQSLVGDEKIYLKWEIPEGSQADGYLIYLKSDEDKDFRRGKQEPLLTKYCLLRGAKNGVRYHLIVRSLVNGQEKYSCNEWVTTPRPVSEDAKKYYDQGVSFYNEQKFSASLYSARKAEELDPNNYDIKNLIRKLETTHHEGLVSEEDKK